jgi:hypothetical protein
MKNMPNKSINDEVFFIEDIKFGVKWLSKGKDKDIEGYQAEILKIRGPILIPHIHKLFNLSIRQGFPKTWNQSLIVPIFKRRDKRNPSNYRTIIISPILTKLYGSILEKKIDAWIERHGKRARGKFGFRGYHSTMDHLVTFRIIIEECRNDKTDLLCCFIDFRKVFNTVPRTNLWHRLEEIKVPFELRNATIRLYEKFIAKFRNTKGWLEEINYNIDCVGLTLASIVIILLLYVDDIFLMVKSPYDLCKKLITLKDLCCNMGMTMNTKKTNFMIIKSKRTTCDTFVYYNNNLEEVPSYKYLGIDIHHKRKWNYSIEKRINGGWKAYYGL